MYKKDQAVLRFVHATDLHYESGEQPQVPEANARIECLINDINRLHEKQTLSFVIFSGDITNCGSANARPLSAAKHLCDKLAVPYHLIAGNHDLAPNRGIAANYPGKEDYHEGSLDSSYYAGVFGGQGLRFAFIASGYRFLGLSMRDEDPDGMLDWLEGELAESQSPVILTAHYGLYPPRDAGPLATWGFSRISATLPRLRTLVEQAGNKVVLYLHGHNHINSVFRRNGTCFVSGGGIQKGCTGFWLFECFPQRIEGVFHLISDETLRNFDYWSCADPSKCRDSTHHTLEEYHRGNIEEQRIAIALTNK